MYASRVVTKYTAFAHGDQPFQKSENADGNAVYNVALHQTTGVCLSTIRTSI